MNEDGTPFLAPFQERIDFFRQKVNMPTERWDDIRQAAHDRAFVVAGAMKADLLADLRRAVDRAIVQGTSLEAFREDFRQIVYNRGWTGWTGEGSQAGFNWWTKVIWETNLRSSYAAGRWAQLNDPGLKKLMPYWRYVHADSVMSPRLQHLAWGQRRLTLPSEHQFRKTHFPHNGWGCRCRVTAVAAPKAGDATEPRDGWDEPGEDGTLPGIDKGWGYAAGGNVDVPLRQVVQDKLITYPPAISKALSRDVNRSISTHNEPRDYVTRVLSDRSKTDLLWLGFVENFEEVSAAAEVDTKGFINITGKHNRGQTQCCSLNSF
jgi:hypothetical protein